MCQHDPALVQQIALAPEIIHWCSGCGAVRTLAGTQAWVLPYNAGLVELGKEYAAQLEASWKILVRAGILTQKEVDRQGLRFALENKFEPAEAEIPK